MTCDIQGFFDPATHTITYVVADVGSGACAIVDPVLDYDPKSGKYDTRSAAEIVAHVRANELAVQWILETHAHADHLSAAPYLKQELGGQIAIGRAIGDVQEIFSGLFNTEPDFRTDGSQFDHLLADDDRITIGGVHGYAMSTPGHTPACMTYVFGDTAFVGDTLFMPDYGTARADFPGGDAATLYQSIRRILALPPETRLFMCHDYMPGGREVRWETTVAEQRAANIHIADGVSEQEFVEMRNARDATLQAPTLLLPSIQVNMRAGRFPPAEDNGVCYLKIPLRAA